MSFGAGPTIPAGSSTQTDRIGANLGFAVGYRVSERFSIPFEFLVSLDPVPGPTLALANQVSGIYTYLSLLFDPTFIYRRRGNLNWYVLGGGGFSVKSVIYQIDTGIDQGDGTTTIVTGRASTNQPAVDFGTGVSWSIRGSDAALYLEARYEHLFNPAGPYAGLNTAGTSLVPVIVGVRWGGTHGRRPAGPY